MLRRDTTTASYEQVVLSTQPNTILYFGIGGDLNALSASTIYITSSYAVSASYSLNGGGAGGGGLTNIDGGFPDSVYGGTTLIDGGAP